MANIAIIGAGSWGSSLSVLLSGNGHQVTVWSCFPEEVQMLHTFREHRDKLPGVKIPERVLFTGKLQEAVEHADQVVFVVPSQTIRQNARAIAPLLSPEAILVCCSKGLEEATGLRLSEVIAEEAPDHCVVGLYGPSHAEEVAIGVPTTVVSASVDRDAAEAVQDAFMSPSFRVYTSTDLVGAEIGSALKNVIALCAGICDGLGFGDNSKAALMTRGITEIARLGTAMGANAKTFSGLTGIGDLSHVLESLRGGVVGERGARARPAGEQLERGGDRLHRMGARGRRAARRARALARRLCAHRGRSRPQRRPRDADDGSRRGGARDGGARRAGAAPLPGCGGAARGGFA
mgnify:CR=1 FL=1